MPSIPVKHMLLLRQSIHPADGMFFRSGNLNATMTNVKACKKPVNNPKIQLVKLKTCTAVIIRTIVLM